MDRSNSLRQLRAAQDTYQGIPWSNTIAASSSATAYFADASVVPHVTNAEAARCVTTRQGRAAYPGLTILNGATSACAWGSDPGPIEPGIFGPRRYPHLTRTDDVANSNDSAWLTNPADPHSDQTILYSRKRWVTERFTPAQTAADPDLQILTLSIGAGRR